jgi:hypothetical protein
MANNVQVVGDPNTNNEHITGSLQNFYKASGILIAVNGSPVENSVQTANGSSFFHASAIPINFFGNADTDEATRDGTQVPWFIIQS